jgi:hypothetical protein
MCGRKTACEPCSDSISAPQNPSLPCISEPFAHAQVVLFYFHFYRNGDLKSAFMHVITASLSTSSSQAPPALRGNLPCMPVLI